MSTKSIAVVGSLVAVGALVFFMYIGASNAEKRLRNTITAKQRDNHSEIDNMQKKLSQSGQITAAQMQMVKDIVIGNSQARTANGAGSLATLVREAVPNIDTSTFRQLMNVVTASRDAWTQRQKELLDLKREHDNLIDTAPSSWFVGGRGKIEVQIVTSSRAEESFRTGQDNDVNLFGTPAAAK